MSKLGAWCAGSPWAHDVGEPDVSQPEVHELAVEPRYMNQDWDDDENQDEESDMDADDSSTESAEQYRNLVENIKNKMRRDRRFATAVSEAVHTL